MKKEERNMPDDLLVKYLLGEVSETEQGQVQQWIKESEENKQYFYDLKLIWNQSRNVVAASSVTAEDAWARFKQRTEQVNATPRSIPMPVNNYRWLKVAAALLLLAGGTWLTWDMVNRRNDTQVALNTTVEHESPAGATTPDSAPKPATADPKVAYWADQANKVKGVSPVAAKKQKITKPESTNDRSEAPVKTETAQSPAYVAAPVSPAPAVAAKAKSLAAPEVTTPVIDAADKSSDVTKTITANRVVSTNSIASNSSSSSSVTGAPVSSYSAAGSVAVATTSHGNDGHEPAERKRMSRKSMVRSESARPPSVRQYNANPAGSNQQKYICNGTPCPLEICITQSVKCQDGKPAAYSTCRTLEPDESGQIGLKMFGKMSKDCKLTIQEIKITQVNTGETIILNENSSPATAQDVYNYITGKMKGGILAAGEFHSDCDNAGGGHMLKFDNNNYGHLILQ